MREICLLIKYDASEQNTFILFVCSRWSSRWDQRESLNLVGRLSGEWASISHRSNWRGRGLSEETLPAMPARFSAFSCRSNFVQSNCHCRKKATSLDFGICLNWLQSMLGMQKPCSRGKLTESPLPIRIELLYEAEEVQAFFFHRSRPQVLQINMVSIGACKTVSSKIQASTQVNNLWLKGYTVMTYFNPYYLISLEARLQD